MADLLQSERWPPQCCVAAFLSRAVAGLAGCEPSLHDELVRSRLAHELGVKVGPGDHNPWRLPIAHDSRDWGIPTSKVRGSLRRVCSILDCDQQFNLETYNLNTIAFALYEDAIADLSRSQVVLGISFDYLALKNRTEFAGGGQGRHVVRLTPLTPEENASTPNIFSPEFKFDYEGPLRIYDDSGELAHLEQYIDWRELVSASLWAEGGIWCVREAAGE